MIVDQRLLPRIVEGEVRMLMVQETLFQIIHKVPRGGGMSAVGGVADYHFFSPDGPDFAPLRISFIERDLPQLREVLGMKEQPMPLIWTADFIPVDKDRNSAEHDTHARGAGNDFVIGELNCSCVGVSAFAAACGADRGLRDVTREAFLEGNRLCDLIGENAVCWLAGLSVRSKI